jgi:uncharacterized protein (TIGR03067 family)
MSWLRAVVLGVGLVAASAAAQDEKKPAKLDAAKLAGTWKLAEGMSAGVKSDAERLKGTATFAQDKITLKDDDMTFVIGYKLDSTATPVAIDMEILEPDFLKGSKGKGIIKLEAGKLTLCYDPKGEERPKKFESTKENGAHLFVMTKKDADEKKPKAAADK